MRPAAASNAPLCHACHARLKTGEDRCWLCGAPVTSGDEAAAATESVVSSPPSMSSPAASFSMATLMLFVTLVSIVCGVISIAPGVGVALALVLVPVITHTAIAGRREEASGHSLGAGDRIMLFFASLGLVVVAGVAASIAFGITCFGGFFGGAALGDAMGAQGYDFLAWGGFTGMGLGTIAGAFVGYRALVALSRNSMWRREGLPSLSRGSKIMLAVTFLLAAIGVAVVCLYGM